METTHFESLYPPDCRFAEIEKIISFVKIGQSCQLVGVPGSGRSNLLRFLAFNRDIRIKHLGEGQSNFHFLYLDFAQVKGKELAEVHKFLFLTLVESFKERGFQKAHQETEKLFRQSLALADPLVLFQNLKKAVDILTNELGLTLVFLFDRFEEYLEMVTSEFFLNLRLLRNLSKYRFSVVFVLNRPLEKTLGVEVFGEFYEFLVGHLVYLPLWDEPGIQFRLAHLEEISGKKLTPKTREEILHLTGGHGKLTKICAELALELTHLPGGGAPRQFGGGRHLEGEKLEEKKLEEFLVSQDKVWGACLEILGALAPQERELLGEIALGKKVQENEVLSFLQNLDLLRKTNGSFTLAIPLLVPYLKVRGLGEEKIYFRPETNEIIKGEKVISDDLSSQEFRLLKFFLQNPGKVCEREEVIQAVWPEAKSTAGITDQAIDQMIFRLRKKIETDPQNPKHLLTIKGRGFRFGP